MERFAPNTFKKFKCFFYENAISKFQVPSPASVPLLTFVFIENDKSKLISGKMLDGAGNVETDNN